MLAIESCLQMVGTLTLLLQENGTAGSQSAEIPT